MGKTIIALTILIAGWMQPLRAQHKEVGVADAAFERNGSNIEVDFDIDLSRLDLKSTGAVLLTPRMVNGNDSVDLPSVGIYGRRRYYHYVRNGESMLTGKDETVLRTADCPDTFAYSAAVPYGEWMSGARLKLACYEYGCCNSILDEWMLGLGGYVEYVPKMLYVTPVAQGVKTDSITGTAYEIFEVDKTVLKPEIMDNRTEIGKINASIDTVRSDKDITILNVDLKGFASPESPYSHNADLAKGRVQALKTHLQRLHHFDEGVVRTGYEPENWEGLRRFVERSNLEHRSEILAMIDSGMEPDAKEAAIKRAYPDEYKFLLDNCYPSLRRTDYCIRYVVRNFTDIYDIERIMRTQPQKLSLNELYLLANSHEPGSDEFCDVFDVAVKMYPHDAVANLNAANAAMQRGDYVSSQRYLDKAGNSPEAAYARGVHAYLTKDYERARALLEEARKGGIAEAETVIAETEKRMKKLAAKK